MISAVIQTFHQYSIWVIFAHHVENYVLANVYKQLIDLSVHVVNAESKMHDQIHLDLSWSLSACDYMIYLTEFP